MDTLVPIVLMRALRILLQEETRMSQLVNVLRNWWYHHQQQVALNRKETARLKACQTLRGRFNPLSRLPDDPGVPERTAPCSILL